MKQYTILISVRGWKNGSGWKYKGDKYKVYFGYGVDLPYYKKWHIVNYYRSVGYIWAELKYRIKRGII